MDTLFEITNSAKAYERAYNKKLDYIVCTNLTFDLLRREFKEYVVPSMVARDVDELHYNGVKIKPLNILTGSHGWSVLFKDDEIEV